MTAGTRVVVGMSGGVDSSVCAALLAEAGHEVVGVTLQLYDHGKAVGRKGACCAGQDIHDARQVADRLGIAHYVLDYEARFKSAVIDEFAGSYAKGETPIPCVLCNQTVKFTDLLETARDLGAEALATGHYARRMMGAGGPELHRALDAERDQSYFLFATTRDQLDFLRFPLGDRTKAEIREIARRFDLPVAEKPDSQDICFVPNGSYSSVVEAVLPETRRPGDIVTTDGTVLGRHDGIVHFTIGQRRGLRVGGRLEPLFVLRIEADTARVVVGPRAELAVSRVRLHGVNWLGGGAMPEVGSEVEVKLRSAQPPVLAEILSAGAGNAEIRLATPAFGVAPGQAGVLYQGSRLVGGGWIRAEAAAEQAA